MKKISLLAVMAIFICTGLFLTKGDAQAQTIDGWFLAGNAPQSYAIGLDDTDFISGSSSAILESTEQSIDGFGTLMQTSSPQDFLGKKVKMSAYIKSENIKNVAGMWLRIDAKNSKINLGFDNMRDRPIVGTNKWEKYEIIMNVPEESNSLNYGILLNGVGKVWFDNLTFEIVGEIDDNISKEDGKLKRPSNTDFEK
jgi:hypothetical protein